MVIDLELRAGSSDHFSDVESEGGDYFMARSRAVRRDLERAAVLA